MKQELNYNISDYHNEGKTYDEHLTEIAWCIQYPSFLGHVGSVISTYEIHSNEPITAQLSFKEEAAGKLRIFAMLDP